MVRGLIVNNLLGSPLGVGLRIGLVKLGMGYRKYCRPRVYIIYRV